ncbi:MAG: ABC transporter ATP-binding protein [Anaerolineales bacterium]|nr:ABC transporter ATP-binding protein [Anaerolineales bacterium]
MKDNSITIQTSGLVKKFGDFTAVNHISFTVKKGEIFGFLGPNGSGKTTTIRMMLGLLPPTQGSIEVLGIPVPDLITDILPRIGYMSQQFSLYNDLTVAQNLEFYGQAYGLVPENMGSVIREAVELSGLDGFEDTPTKDLSGGWRQRLALSAAILHRPEVLFLDEPTAGVDPISRRLFWDLLYELVAEGITVFITTHYMDEAEHCHRLAFIQHGEIIAQGTPTEIKREAMIGDVLEIDTNQTEDLIKAIYEARDNGDNRSLNAELYGSLIHIFSTQPKQHTKYLQTLAKGADIKINSISVIEPSLEDVFIACMRDSDIGGNHEE